MPRISSRTALLAIVALALFLRLAPLDHGMPRGYVPDTHMVRNSLGMLRDKNPVPPMGRYSSYPYLVPYMLAPIYAAEYATGRVGGAWAGPGQFGVRISEDPRWTALPARALMALLGAAIAWVLFRAARAAGLEGGARVTAWLAATCLLAVQFSIQERPWIAVVFFGSLCMWAAVVHERGGSRRSLLLAGAAAGLSFASHQAGLVFLGLCGLAWAFAPGGWRGPGLVRRVAGGFLCVLTFLLVALVLGHAYYLHGAVGTDAVVGGEQAAGKLSIGGQAVRMGMSLASLKHLSTTLFGYDPALVLLGLGGLVLGCARRGLRAVSAFSLAAGAFFLTNPSDHVRYLLPLCILLALLGGVASERLLAGRAGRLALGFLLLVPLVQALRFDWLLTRSDTRALAERQLGTLPPGALLAIDHYGPTVDLSRAALERNERLRGSLYTRESIRLQLLEAGVYGPERAGLDAVRVEELFEVDPGSGEYVVRAGARDLGATPADVLAELGVTHLLLVDRRPGDDEPSELGPLAAGRASPWSLSPRSDGTPPREAFLPTEMDFPLTALWSVSRPGPWMRLVEL